MLTVTFHNGRSHQDLDHGSSFHALPNGEVVQPDRTFAVMWGQQFSIDEASIYRYFFLIFNFFN